MARTITRHRRDGVVHIEAERVFAGPEAVDVAEANQLVAGALRVAGRAALAPPTAVDVQTLLARCIRVVGKREVAVLGESKHRGRRQVRSIHPPKVGKPVVAVRIRRRALYGAAVGEAHRIKLSCEWLGLPRCDEDTHHVRGEGVAPVVAAYFNVAWVLSGIRRGLWWATRGIRRGLCRGACSHQRQRLHSIAAVARGGGQTHASGACKLLFARCFSKVPCHIPCASHSRICTASVLTDLEPDHLQVCVALRGAEVYAEAVALGERRVGHCAGQVAM